MNKVVLKQSLSYVLNFFEKKEAQEFLLMTHFCLGLRNMDKLEGIFQSRKLEHTGKSNKILKKSGNFKQMLYIILTDI